MIPSVAIIVLRSRQGIETQFSLARSEENPMHRILIILLVMAAEYSSGYVRKWLQ